MTYMQSQTTMKCRGKRVIVIGEGPAGMMAAIAAARNGCNVTILERNEYAGKKLLITGKGRCNVTNAVGSTADFISNVPVNGRFMYSSYSAFDSSDVMNFFENADVPLKIERGNRVFPVSDKSSDIRDALVREVISNKITVRKSRVKSLIIENNDVKGVTLGNSSELFCDSVIIATGGLSYPKTGSTGDGYMFAEKAGHTIIPPSPSLVPMTSPDKACSDMMGLSLKNIAVKLIDKDDNNKIIYEDFGEMLFTHFGVSGPVILSASSHLRNHKEINCILSIDLKPALDDKKLNDRLLRDFELFKNKDVENALVKLLPHSMIHEFVLKSGVPADVKVNQMKKEQREALIKTFKEFRIDINGLRPIEEAIITSGGVSVKEINPKTMQSKLMPSLFFAGEIIDVDAYTGGFNLQIAFSTGYCAGNSQ